MTAHRLNPVDAIWLNTESAANLMVIEALVFLDGPLDRARLEDVLQHRVVDRHPIFRQRLAVSRIPSGPLSWVDTPGFDIADHIREVVLDTPGDDAALQRHVNSFLGEPLPRDRPLWQVHMVQGLEEGAALYFRLHHSLADGIALTRVLLSLTDADPDADPGTPPDTEALTAGAAATAEDSIIDEPLGPGPFIHRSLSLVTAALHPARLVATVLTVLRAIPALAKLVFAFNPINAMSARDGRARPEKAIVWSAPESLPRIKELALATGSTVNDVLVAALAGAVHRYQHEHGGATIDVNTMIPVNLRPAEQPLPRQLGNRFAVVLLTLPSGLRNPLVRLAETKRRMDVIKSSPEAVLTYAIIHAIGLTGSGLSHWLGGFFANKADAITTNVPGPTKHRYLAGTRISGLLGWVPTSTNQTLGICIFTYAGTVRVGFKADLLAIPDPQSIVVAFTEEIEALHRRAVPSAWPASVPFAAAAG